MPQLYYFNTSFDFDLGHGLNEKLRPVCAEMSLYSLLMLKKGDASVIKIEFDHSYPGYLAALGFFPSVAGKKTPADIYYGHAWGWNEESVQVLTSYNAECVHPPLDAVKRVNGRDFSSLAARDLRLPGAGKILRSSAECKAYLAEEQMRPLLFKPMHGSSGSGFMTAGETGISERMRAQIMQMCDNGGAVAEPKFSRERDFGVNFTVAADGGFSLESIHQAHISPSGKFTGIYTADDIFHPEEQIEDTLYATAERISGFLHKAGYFGPAGIDAFTYFDGQCVKLNPMCEINARLSMGRVARSCRDILGGRFSLLKQIRCNRAVIPDNYAALPGLLGDVMYSEKTKRGIALLSPLRIVWENDRRAPLFSLVYIAANSADDCRYLGSAAEKIFGKTLKRTP